MRVLLILGSVLLFAIWNVNGEDDSLELLPDGDDGSGASGDVSEESGEGSGESSENSSGEEDDDSGEIEVTNNTLTGNQDEDPCDQLDCSDTEICVTGCEDKGDDCVPTPECKSELLAAPLIRICRKKNQRFRLCGSKCEDTCDNPNRKCKGCAWFKCQCKKGYLRDRKWNCIKKKNCPKTCKTLKCPSKKKCREPPARCVWKKCKDIKCKKYYKCKYGPPARCVRIKCSDIKCKKGYKCNKRWPPKCVPITCRDIKKCKRGFTCIEKPKPKCVATCKVIRCRPDWECVDGPPGKCYKTCKLIKCRKGWVCEDGPPAKCVREKTCATIKCRKGWECDPGPPPKCFGTCDVLKCRPGSFCITGPPAKCIRSCPRNEVFRECGTSCEPTCDVPSPTVCTRQCVPKVCQCDTGYVRDTENDKCVLPVDCPNGPRK